MENEVADLMTAKIIFNATAAGKNFSLMRYMIAGKRKYSVHESGVDVFYTTDNIEKAYSIMMKRMHLVYNLSLNLKNDLEGDSAL